MFYINRRPCPALRPFVRSLWLAWNPDARHNARRQRVLPNGCIQVILNLAGDWLTDVSGLEAKPSAPALIVGAQQRFQTIATEDMAHLAGVVLRPGGFWPVFGMDADAFSGRETALDAAVGRQAEELRERMREQPSPEASLNVLEEELSTRIVRRGLRARCGVTELTLAGIQAGRPISEIVKGSGLSAGRLVETFRRQVGITPKMFGRIQRFQRAVQTIHRGEDVSWAELAFDCGFYDQAHLNHEFRAFSGMCPTEYTRWVGPWSNHVALD